MVRVILEDKFGVIETEEHFVFIIGDQLSPRFNKDQETLDKLMKIFQEELKRIE